MCGERTRAPRAGRPGPHRGDGAPGLRRRPDAVGALGRDGPGCGLARLRHSARAALARNRIRSRLGPRKGGVARPRICPPCRRDFECAARPLSFHQRRPHRGASLVRAATGKQPRLRALDPFRQLPGGGVGRPCVALGNATVAAPVPRAAQRRGPHLGPLAESWVDLLRRDHRRCVSAFGFGRAAGPAFQRTGRHDDGLFHPRLRRSDDRSASACSRVSASSRSPRDAIPNASRWAGRASVMSRCFTRWGGRN